MISCCFYLLAGLSSLLRILRLLYVMLHDTWHLCIIFKTLLISGFSLVIGIVSFFLYAFFSCDSMFSQILVTIDNHRISNLTMKYSSQVVKLYWFAKCFDICMGLCFLCPLKIVFLVLAYTAKKYNKWGFGNISSKNWVKIFLWNNVFNFWFFLFDSCKVCFVIWLLELWYLIQLERHYYVIIDILPTTVMCLKVFQTGAIQIAI